MSAKKPVDAKQNGGIYATVGNNNNMIIIGSHNVQTQGAPASSGQVSETEKSELRDMFVQLKKNIDISAPPGKKASALERIDEVEQALLDNKPEPGTIEYVKNWFHKNIPSLNEAVTAVFTNPIFLKMVQMTGSIAADELKKKAMGN